MVLHGGTVRLNMHVRSTGLLRSIDLAPAGMRSAQAVIGQRYFNTPANMRT
jgi:hypothetical protein